MKCAYAATVIAGAVLFQACGGGGNGVNAVKRGIMDFDKSITVGEAFDNWSACQTRGWSAFKTQNGRNMVQFICKKKNTAALIQSLASRSGGKVESFLDVAEMTQTFQWKINKDDSFELSYVGTETKWKDGVTAEGAVSNPMMALKSVYDNEDVLRKNLTDGEFLGWYNLLQQNYYASKTGQ